MRSNRLTVGPDTVRMLELGHPWVIADSYTRRWPSVERGEVAELADERGRLIGTALLDPADRIVARVLSPGPMQLNTSWLCEKIGRALALRTAHAELAGTTAYRLVNAEGDGLPGLTIDRYEDHLMVQLYTGAWQPHLPLLCAALLQVISPAGIYWKSRPQQTRTLSAEREGKKNYSRLLAGSRVQGAMNVKENDISFQIHLEEGLHTGLFLDQRRNRRDLMERARGKTFLNLFAYTGAFSVAAAVAGAERVVSVDASAPYLAWARENFGLNRLNPKRHEFIQGDCFEVLSDLRQHERLFDIVLMDPPSFSTTSSSRFTTRQGTAEIAAAALALLPPGGLLIASSNHQKIDLPEYLKELRRGALLAGCALRVIRISGQSEDFPFPVTFPEGRYLKYVVAVKDV
jgi:23S rRNA (cytosine1962-C5)-methyltransferase